MTTRSQPSKLQAHLGLSSLGRWLPQPRGRGRESWPGRYLCVPGGRALLRLSDWVELVPLPKAPALPDFYLPTGRMQRKDFFFKCLLF